MYRVARIRDVFYWNVAKWGGVLISVMALAHYGS